MAEGKTKPTEDDVAEFLDRIPDAKRRSDCRVVLALMAEVTQAAAEMWGKGIVGFGRCRYKYASGREGEWMLTGFAPRKNDVTLYITQGFEPYPDLMARLGKYSAGKSCLHIKKIEDVAMDVLRELITRSVESLADRRIEGG